ncbi:MAG: HEAT repeat domain-containing protein, partial [Myxococcus sp.]|nr:HEAT repeat domain-containing protein [Myxococcus sp.]
QLGAFDFVAAFAVVRGAAVGWDSRGDGDVEAVRQLAVPLDAASVFRTVALTRGSYVGPLPPDALTQHYLALLGRSPRTVFLWPVEVQSRLVAMLYGDCGSKPVSQRRLADFILFCQDLPTAFHDLILFRKQNPKAPQDFADVAPLPAYAGDEAQGAEVPTDADWFNGLIGLLTGPDASERSMAMLELMKTPEASAAALSHAFPGPTGWSRLPVVDLPESDELGPIPGALTRLGHPAAVALAPLLDSSDSDARYLALLTAGSLRYPEVIDGVMRGLFDLEPDISSAARAAATSLRYLPTFQSRLHELRQELASNDPLRRSLAARALGVLHDRDAIDGLINLTGSDDELVATSAAEALKEITRANFGPQPRAWTAWYARARSQRRIEWLVEALASDDFDLRLSSIEELSRTFGDNFGFFADGPQAERLASLEQWQNVVGSRPDFDV